MTLADAMRKARYGHKDWIYWRDKEGVGHAEPKSIETVKRCLLDCGTQKKWYLVTANDGHSMYVSWPIGINLIAHMKRGYY